LALRAKSSSVQSLLTIRVANAPSSIAARERIEMRVLLIEDDGATAQSIELMLKAERVTERTARRRLILAA
jgi:hypothetical protein